jgi:two-component system chemotaxis response regulator CheB
MNSAPPAGEFRQLVVIGASLGGLNALKTVLSALPPDFPCPIVVVQHREKTTEDLLTGLLETVCALPVAETEDKEPVAWGRVYLAPVNYHLLVEEGHFALSVDGPVNHTRPSIDVLFESAAEAYGERVVGVILTGANEDGARGLAAVKENGGIAVVQDPSTAEAPRMPEAALAAVTADAVLPLEAIGPFLTRLSTGRGGRSKQKASPGSRNSPWRSSRNVRR